MATFLLLLASMGFASPATCIGEAGSTAGWGCRREFAGHTVLNLHGTDSDIGRLYGGLFEPELRAAYLPMMQSMELAIPAPLRAALGPHRESFPEFFDAGMAKRAAGFEASLALPAGTSRRFSWISELSSIGPALQVASSGMAQIDGVTRRPIGGCTTAVGVDQSGATVHARNVDFWGMEFWQPHAAVVFVEPLDSAGNPDGYRYAQVSDLGEIFAGTTGINEVGLTVTTHLHVSRDVPLLAGRLRRPAFAILWNAAFGPKNQPQVSVLRVVETALRRAGDVAEAIDLLAELRTVGAWSFVMSDPTGARAVVGMNAYQARASRGANVQTNFYPDPTMRERELLPARGPVEGAVLRYERARELLDAHDGTFDVPAAIALLRDRYDAATGQDRAASANSILSPDATQSIVFVTRPGEIPTLWLAIPHEDGVTPAPLAPYVSLSFNAGFHPADCPDGCIEQTLPYEPGPLDEAATRYSRAIAALVDHHDGQAALTELRAIPDADGGVRLMTAWLAASLGEQTIAAAELAAARDPRLRLGTHHQILAAFLDGTLARQRGAPDEAAAAFGLALRTADEDHGPTAYLNALFRPAIQSRITRPNAPRPGLPPPDLKFQDVFGLK